MNATVRIRIFGVFLCLFLVSAMAGPASAVTDVFLRAEIKTLMLPSGGGGTTSVPAWGFAQDSAFDAGDGILSVPGPVLKLPAGETVLRIHLDNNLAEPISLNISGQMLTNNSGPVFSELGDTTVYPPGARPIGNQTARVRSFSHETPPGNTAAVVYEYNSLRPGTFLYSSGTNPAKQVQMGLYGALTIDAAAGEAYTGVPYTKELVLLYSEVDPVMNGAISDGTYGTGGLVTSSLKRKPKYFMVNGMAFETGGGLDPLNALTALGTDDRILLRFINAGYILHVPELVNMTMSVVAEDGNPFVYPKEQYSLEMPAGKVFDAILKPVAEGTFPLYDAALHLTNAGSGAAEGGMLAYLDIALVDTDGDGVVDNADNCTLVANSAQTDSNGDGFGNRCDTDLNNDNITNGLDVGILKTQFLTAGPDADFNVDGVVNGLDVGILKTYFLQAPGPSGVAP